MSLFGEDFSRNIRDSRNQARKSPKGVDPEQLVPDAVFTHSPNKHTGDRSGIEAIWKVIATNTGQVVLECLKGDYIREVGSRQIKVIHEHEWYPAEHLLDELNLPETKEAD